MKTLGNPPPGIQSLVPARRPSSAGDRRTVLGGKGSLRRGKHRPPLPPARRSAHQLSATDGSDGNQKQNQFLRLTKDENQVQ